MGVNGSPNTAQDVPVPACDCLKKRNVKPPWWPDLHKPGCPRMAAIKRKYGVTS